MPLKTRFLSFVSNATTRRFGSKASRFRLAVTSGFALVAVAFLTITVDEHPGFAQGFLESLFGGGQLSIGQAGPAYTSARPVQATYYRRVARAHSGTRVRNVAFQARASETGPREGSSARGGGTSFCVRLCDGFAFPVGAYRGGSDRAAHEATCHSECPGATTALYVLPSGSDAMKDAFDVRSGKNYSELPAAFHYTTLIDGACSCHPPSGSRIKSLLHDFTLRRGDAVMTGRGFRVFHGAPHFPFQRRDFVALNRSRDIGKNVRPTYQAIERASLKSRRARRTRTSSPPAPRPKPARSFIPTKPAADPG